MKVYALLSWFDEDPDDLHECVTSCAKIADHVVAVDGRYALYPDTRVRSPLSNAKAIRDAAKGAGLGLTIHRPNAPWAGGEVEKRAAMFALAETVSTPDDWYLIVDGDMRVHWVSDDARGYLTTNYPDTAEVFFQDVSQSGAALGGQRFRSMFRALRGLTVRQTHWLYMHGDRYMWHGPNGTQPTEPAIDLIQHVTLHHRRLFRDKQRNDRAAGYYAARQDAQLEVIPR